jgi:hypothetical protein
VVERNLEIARWPVLRSPNKDLAHYYAGIWTSPVRVNPHMLLLVPFAGASLVMTGITLKVSQ